MKILILGGDGMLGQQLLKSWRDRHEVRVTLRGNKQRYACYGLFDAHNADYDIDVRDFGAIERLAKNFQPEAIVNAVGIVKQRQEAHDVMASLEVNALLPHRLSQLCGDIGARLIHFSTDCVFSGSRGMYREGDLEDATDLYGRTKLLGEVYDKQAVTLRTSIIGLELARKQSLLEWFLVQKGEVAGFTAAIYSGFTTLEMARIIESILIDYKDMSGLWHVASEPISKFHLLSILSKLMGREDIRLVANADFCCERSLDASRFNNAIAYQPPSWHEMLLEQAVQIRDRSNEFTG